MTTAQGYNGTVTVEGDTLVISRDTMTGRVAFGKDAPPRRIPLSAITAARLKPASRLVNGHLSLGLNGAAPASTGVPSDVDSVVFTHKHRDAFTELHTWLLTVLQHNATADASGLAAEGGGASLVDRVEARKQASLSRLEE
jgi:hypothetical protein